MPASPQAELARLRAACDEAGINGSRCELLSLGDSATFAVGDSIVAKVTRFPGQQAVAHREVAVSRWLADVGLPAVTAAIEAVDQGLHSVTFWHKLPDLRPATPAEIGEYLARLHATAVPADPELPALEPFVRIADRVNAAPLKEQDKEFLRRRLDDLMAQWPAVADLPTTVIHGDPHRGNVVATLDGAVLVLDLERFSLGPPEWDLTLPAAEHDSFAWISREQYQDFATSYGHDIRHSPAYSLLRDIRELRMTTWLANKADQSPAIRQEVHHRIQCLRGDHGERPWTWIGH